MAVYVDPYDASYPPELWENEQPAARVAVAARTTAAPAPAGTTTVLAGAPGSYVPARKASERPRNLGELRDLSPEHPEPWRAGQYVLIGGSGKRAHWTGSDWAGGEAPDSGPVELTGDGTGIPLPEVDPALYGVAGTPLEVATVQELNAGPAFDAPDPGE